MRLLLSLAAALLLIILAMEVVSQRALHARVQQAAARQAALPRRILWVWERPEDLRRVDPDSTGLAILEATLRLGATASLVPRRQPVLAPERAQQIAVVRMEDEPGFAAKNSNAALLQTAIKALDRIARQPGIAALEVDFDARRSERGFYRDLLKDLRHSMPAGLPLEITALVSWCSNDDWIGDLPINAATPMFFRMEPDRRRLPLNAALDVRLREPLCAGSVGVSTAEPWPPGIAGKQIFLFADHGWAKDLALVSGLEQASEPR